MKLDVVVGFALTLGLVARLDWPAAMRLDVIVALALSPGLVARLDRPALVRLDVVLVRWSGLLIRHVAPFGGPDLS
jgi:hypothetical protein